MEIVDVKIPQIIHQIWYQGESSLPEKYIRYQKTWKDLHPDFNYQFWDENRIIKLLVENYPDFYPLWLNLKYMIQKIDAAKILILHSWGGLIIDADMEAIRPINDLLTASIVFSKCYVHPMGIAIAKVLGLKNFSKTTINNGFIACTRNHPVMARTIKLMETSVSLPENTVHSIFVAKTCGTEVLVEALYQIDHERAELKQNKFYDVYDSEYFEPKIKLRDKEPLITKNTHVIHHTDRTWIKDSPVAKIQTFIFFLIMIIICSIVGFSVLFILFKNVVKILRK